MRTSPSSNFISDMQDVVDTIRITRTSSTQYLDRLLDTYVSGPRVADPEAGGVSSGGEGWRQGLYTTSAEGYLTLGGEERVGVGGIPQETADVPSLPLRERGEAEEEREEEEEGEGDLAGLSSSAGMGTPRSIGSAHGMEMGGEEIPQVELPSFRQLVESGVPFLLLLLAIFMFHHVVGISVSLWLGTVFYFSNVHLKVHVARRAERSRGVLAFILASVLFHVVVVQKVFAGDDLKDRLLLLPPPESLPLEDIVWALVLNDFCVRFVAIAAKSATALIWSNWRRTRERGQILSMIELTLNLYRSVLPIPLWYTYFTTQDYGVVLSVLLTTQYIVSKLYLLSEHVALYLDSLLALYRARNQFSVHATKAQIAEHGDICPICQDDFEDAVILRCKHMFCESCVTEWFHYNKTCPMCRAEIPIAETIARSDGHTSMMAILF